MNLKDLGLPLTYLGGFMVGFTVPSYGHWRGDHILFPIGLVLVAVGAVLYFKK